jgi:hypothetical protein
MTNVTGSTSRTAVGNTQPVASTGLGGDLDFNAVSKAAVEYLNQTKKENDAAIAKDGVGLRYGAKSAFGKLSRPERYKYVQNIVRRKNPGEVMNADYINGLLDRMRGTSCIGYTMESLAAGYAAAGKSERWNEIAGIVRAKGTIGTVLVAELQKDGWEAVYWNADTKTYRGPTEGPKDKQRRDDHQFFMTKFLNRDGSFRPGVDASGAPLPRRDYYGTYPQHAMLNFYAGPPNSIPKLDQTVLAKLKNVPYWVGVAASGYHCIQGEGNELRDSHMARDPDDLTNVERRPFEEMTHAWNTAARKTRKTPEGDPVFSEELSGVLVVPPGTWGN